MLSLQFVSQYKSNFFWLNVPYGIPQGFTLGPLLFKIQINDLHKAFANLNITNRADDTKLCFYAKNWYNRIL